MLKSCKYCGRIHEAAITCQPKQNAQDKRWAHKNDTASNKFRHTNMWIKKAIAIKKRDSYLCQCCLHGVDCDVRYTVSDLEVHHIDSVKHNYNRRLDDYNLITVCRYHHELCESDKISKAMLFKIAKTNTDNNV